MTSNGSHPPGPDEDALHEALVANLQQKLKPRQPSKVLRAALDEIPTMGHGAFWGCWGLLWAGILCVAGVVIALCLILPGGAQKPIYRIQDEHGNTTGFSREPQPNSERIPSL